MKKATFLDPVDTFVRRHIGPTDEDVQAMLESLGFDSLDALTRKVVPRSIQLGRELALHGPHGEHETLEALGAMSAQNRVVRSLLGMGYHDCITPPVIQRNILENPGWYTQYTPYQAEIAQGRLEALLNFQTMVADLTALPLANASLLDEATAVAEAMAMCRAIARGKRSTFYVAADCHPQTLAVVQSRAVPIGVRVVVADPADFDLGDDDLFGVVLQYPTTQGRVRDYAALVESVHGAGALAVVACDLLALTLLRPPGEFGADIAVGSAQRFGVPLGLGGPHAAFLSTRDEYKRQIPGRIVGVSKDAEGRPALRLALQTREQHIRRDKATSNICTAQVLLAVMAGMYGVYHGPEGLRNIARRVHGLAATLASGLRRAGHDVGDEPFFDTLRVRLAAGRSVHDVLDEACELGINLRGFADGSLGIALDECSTADEVGTLLGVLTGTGDHDVQALADEVDLNDSGALARTSAFMTQDVFRRFHSEHEMLRYMFRLQGKDLSLTQSMIPLGSCTMKLNGTAQLVPISWPEFAALHPFAPADQWQGYAELFEQLEAWLCEITGFEAVSLQPNAGAQGEYAGLLVVRAYHERRGEGQRNVCLIPTSAHGTNPASAVMAGLEVVLVACLEGGDVDLDDLRAKAEQHRDRLAALMITYPSTHGVFEEQVQEICRVVHDNGGQVYMDGANMNAQVGLCRPADIGADVCHLNLHKTFCIPHGGGGPGMGPIGVAAHLAPFLPGHPVHPDVGGEQAIGPVSAAPYGSPGILPIPWTYIALMGASGLKRATQVAILNANYMARRLEPHYPILYRGRNGLVAHEFILDTRPLKDSAGISVDDIAKRLMDFGIHAPTMSFPVAGTLMIEPTESESREELDRFCEAMITIREEIRDVEDGRADRENNVLKRAPHTARAVTADVWDRPYSRQQAVFPTASVRENNVLKRAPHTARAVTADVWDRPYSRQQAVFPTASVRENKFWPATARIDNAYGDRNLLCTCDAIDSYA